MPDNEFDRDLKQAGDEWTKGLVPQPELFAGYTDYVCWRTKNLRQLREVRASMETSDDATLRAEAARVWATGGGRPMNWRGHHCTSEGDLRDWMRHAARNGQPCSTADQGGARITLTERGFSKS